MSVTTTPRSASGVEVGLDHVSKSFGDVTAVADLTLTVRRGEFLTLLGPSGSGKTTTMMMIAGFEEPSGGAILFDGIAVTDVPPNARETGLVFQNYALFPHMTVAENIGYPLRMRAIARGEVRRLVDASLELVRLSGLGNRYPRQLSGGQQQRVALARALVYGPKVLLLDEPLGALDRQLREQMQLELRRIHAELGTTMIYVTHDQEEALAMSDRIALLNAGRLVQVGTPRQLYEEPVDAFVATFLGESNLLRCRLGPPRDDNRDAVTADGIVLRVPSAVGAQTDAWVTVAIRPERLLVGNGEHGPALRGRVEQVIFIGDNTKLFVRVGENAIVVRQPNRRGAPQAAVGDEIGIAYAPDDVVLLRG
jgi:spermidine/putrescine ABC transporter ATP-binding subunit